MVSPGGSASFFEKGGKGIVNVLGFGVLAVSRLRGGVSWQDFLDLLAP